MSFFLNWEWEILRGVGMTLLSALISLFFALIIGVGVASAKQSDKAGLKVFGDAFTTIIRGTPELLIVFFVYFGSTIAVGSLVEMYGTLRGWEEIPYVEVPTLAVCVFTLSIIFGGYMAESIRGAMLALPKGQIEAAEAYGFSKRKCFLYIKLPLIWRYALPALGNNWLSLLKGTSLISMVGLEELMRKSYIAAGETHQHFRFYSIAAGVYLILTLINVFVLEKLEKHSMRSERTM